MKWAKCKLRDVPVMGMFKLGGKGLYIRVVDSNYASKHPHKIRFLTLERGYTAPPGELTQSDGDSDVDLYMGED